MKERNEMTKSCPFCENVFTQEDLEDHNCPDPRWQELEFPWCVLVDGQYFGDYQTHIEAMAMSAWLGNRKSAFPGEITIVRST